MMLGVLFLLTVTDLPPDIVQYSPPKDSNIGSKKKNYPCGNRVTGIPLLILASGDSGIVSENPALPFDF
jgi:hypothetical protein